MMRPGSQPSLGAAIRNVDPASLARRSLPLHPLLLAAYAVLFLYASNLDDADLGQVIPVLLVVEAVVAGILIVASLVLRDAARAAILVSAGVALFFGYRHVAVLTAESPIAGRPVQLLWALIGLGAVLLAWRGGRPLRIATRALNALGLALILVASLVIVPHELAQVGNAAPPPAPVPAEGPTAPGSEPLRDIWFLVLDRYGSAESLELNYGIEEQLTPWLAAQGFHVTPDAHANYWRTSLSMASVLNLDYIDALTPGLSAADRLKDHAAGRFLTDLGYRYIHIGSIFGPTRTALRATDNPLLENTSDFAAAVFDSSLARTIVRWIGEDKIDPRRQRQADWARFELDALDAAVNVPGPKFVFGHLLLPHPPYVFDAEGNLVSDAADARRSRSEAYEAQMQYLDSRLKKLLEPLLALPEAERPIVVVMADEGPYPARYEGNPQIAGPDPDFDWSGVTDEELRIKFGILHAMLLPGVDPDRVPQEFTAVNTLRFLFDEYFDADLPLRPDRVLIPGRSAQEPVDVADRLGIGAAP
jgi:hypothetical protein